MTSLDHSRPILVLEAATAAGGVALFLPGGVVHGTDVPMGAGAADGLFPAIELLLRRAALTSIDVGAIVCGEGPGSFTSLRIAGALAKGLAHGLGVPLYAYSSLALVAASLPVEAPSGTFVVHADALRGERYVLRCERNDTGEVTPVSTLGRQTIDDLRAGAGTPLVASGSSPAGLDSAYICVPDVRRALAIRGKWSEAPVDLANWEPLYGRLAEAQVKWEAAHGRSLPDDRVS
jgi:tRNA threonylcarbamoyladenosine biosynthesis protein TsaB